MKRVSCRTLSRDSVRRVALVRAANKQHARPDRQNCDKLDDEWVIHAKPRCPTTKCQVTRNSVVCVNARACKMHETSSRNIVLQIHWDSRDNHEEFSSTTGVSDDDVDDSGIVVIWQYNCPPRRCDKTSAIFTAPQRASTYTCFQKHWASCPTNNVFVSICAISPYTLALRK